VVHELGVAQVPAGAERHLQRVDDEPCAHVAGELPADDHAAEDIEHEREEHKPLLQRT